MRAIVRISVGLCLLLGLAGCGRAPEAVSVAEGAPVPGFALKALDGSTVTSQSLAGRVVILNFWATWCAPCLKELPDLQQVAATSGAQVVGIALDEEGAKTVKPFAERHGLAQTANYQVLLGDQVLFEQFNGMGIPYTLVLDAGQRVFKIYRGPATRAELEQDLQALKLNQKQGA